MLMKSIRLLIYVMALGGAGLAVQAGLAQSETGFRGGVVPHALQPSGTLNCFADRAAVTGYYRAVVPEPGEPDVTLRSTPLESQTAGGGYTISFASENATVLDEVTKDTHRFQVYQRGPNGLILLRTKDVGVEVITIDPRNGSFVHTDSGVQTLWNRTNVWAGRCS
ncbi:MAG TPA: hypothetical protein VIG89_04040 [Candidatus Acidoferrales bacterium]